MTEALAAAEAGTEVPFATVSREHGIVGSTRYLALRPEHRSVEIGWTWLHPSAWGTGANVEAKLLQLEHAFDVLGCRRVEFKTDALNERSRGALEALGASFEGIHRKHMLVRDGENRDSAWYAIFDDEWPEVRARLERRLDDDRRLTPQASRTRSKSRSRTIGSPRAAHRRPRPTGWTNSRRKGPSRT